ncbi:hypothetical protein Hanom_Chr11g00973341 [Helianthus anomalus]
MPVLSLRFGYFCDFRPKVCFSASSIWIQKVQNLTVFIQSVNSIHFLTLNQGYFRLFRHFCDD